MNKIGIFRGESTMSRPFRCLLIIASALILVATNVRAQNVTTEAASDTSSRTVIGPIRGVDYGPFRNGESPSLSPPSCFTQADVDQDAPLLATMGNYVRVYSVAQSSPTTCDYYDMVGWLLADGLNVIPSAYLWCLDGTGNNICKTQTDTGVLANNAEVTALINLMTSLSPADRAKIPFVVVGSEAVSFGGMSWGSGLANDLQPYIVQVRNALPSVKVTTAEIYYQYFAPPYTVCQGRQRSDTFGKFRRSRSC